MRGWGLQGAHEIHGTLRKYEFSPGSMHVRKGEQIKLVMAAVDHDHEFKIDDDISEFMQKKIKH